MAVTHLTALRTILADAVDAHVNTGAGTAIVRLRDGTTTIVDFDLQNPAFGAAASGIITLEGTPIETTAEADGDVDNAQIINRNGDISLACSVTAVGMGGDIEVTNVSVANGQDCSLESLTYEAAD
jgi:hypothetical protein